MTIASPMHGKKVAVLGAGGGIGQPLSLLLKSTPSSISKLSLYDICNMGMAVDLSHIPTPVEVTGYSGDDNLLLALNGCDIVVIPAGAPRKPGMTRNDLFNINAGIVKNLAVACAKSCPNAHILIISNPVNSTVPIVYETMKNAGISNPSVFGITTLDVIRAKTFIGQLKGVDPTSIKIDVIGGHSGNTIVPVLSSSSTPVDDVSKDDIKKLIERIQYGGDEVVKAKDGGGSATLSMAVAANKFVQNFIKALDGERGIVENTFIKMPEDGSSVYPASYFAGPVELGTKGISRILPLPKLDSYEQEMLDIAIPELKLNIEQGINYAPSKL